MSRSECLCKRVCASGYPSGSLQTRARTCDCAHLVRMFVGISHLRQTLPAGQTRVYQLADLKPDAMYEVKVSWPATVCNIWHAVC